MGKVTISDFVIALLDLAEAESRALQTSAEAFVRRQQSTLHKTLYQGGWMVGWVAAAVVTFLGALGFLAYGFYRFLSGYLPKTGALFIVGGVLLCVALGFGLLAMRMRKRHGG